MVYLFSGFNWQKENLATVVGCIVSSQNSCLGAMSSYLLIEVLTGVPIDGGAW